MILEKELRKRLAKKLDDLIKLPALIEPFDQMGFNFAFKYLDENYGDKVPLKFVDDIQKAVNCFVDDDYEGLLEVVPNVINDIVDIPGLDEDLEGQFLAINIKASFEFIKYYAEKRLAK